MVLKKEKPSGRDNANHIKKLRWEEEGGENALCQ